MIDYQLLQALYAVVTEKGFDRAAQTLFITQSAVSKRIYQLESLLGEPVLIRTKPPKATELGVKLLTHLQQVKQLELSLNLQSSTEFVDKQLPVSVKISANADSLATWLPEALSVPEDYCDFKYRFEIIAEDQTIALNRMKAGEVMISICSIDKPVNGGKVFELGALRYFVICSPAFKKRYNITSLHQLTELPCLVFDEHDKLQHQFLTHLNGSLPKYTHICPSSEGFKQAMIAGLGYGLLPSLQLGETIEKGELVNLMPEFYLDTPLYWHCWETESIQLEMLRCHAITIASKRLYQII
ncbi:LysR family transcriptional regulator ArgP [Thalassotalea piscium]|uniref:LysR family transcriptional regulator (Chromosome initiation inhibitor) n=1 Tax=Thalassotalea piscium TaxID=1230533 RepID=A0A7X0NJE0_9GAMM|nr:LysR family transcriptional regulator ArgP [Thalassotalea piscium]MBB6544542.1 LysR family transcriptional regulator (chromosome initiation inhibitor) [Thalassotalea piscium]